MKTIVPLEIKTKEEAASFLIDLYKNDELYHPESDAEDIVMVDRDNFLSNVTESRLFNDVEAKKLNRAMDQIYKVMHDPCGFILEVVYKIEK